jgi:outer membrane protein assembly factor BamB
MNWKYSANSSWILTTPVVKDNTVYFGTSDSYLFIALDTETGKERFSVKAKGYVYSSPLICGHTAFFGDFSGNLLAADLEEKGKIQTVFETAGRKKYGADVLLNNQVNFQHAAKGLDLSLYSSTVSGMKKLYQLGPIVSSPCISKGVLYFGSSDGNLYGVEMRKGE